MARFNDLVSEKNLEALPEFLGVGSSCASQITVFSFPRLAAVIYGTEYGYIDL